MKPTNNGSEATPTNDNSGTAATGQSITGLPVQPTMLTNQDQNPSAISGATASDTHSLSVPNDNHAIEVTSVHFGRTIAWLPFSTFVIYLAYLLYVWMFGGAWRSLTIVFIIPVSAIAVGLFFFARAFLRHRNWARLVAIFYYVGSLALGVWLGFVSFMGFIQSRTITSSMDPATVSSPVFQAGSRSFETFVYIMGGFTAICIIVNVLILIALFSKRTRKFFQPGE